MQDYSVYFYTVVLVLLLKNMIGVIFKPLHMKSNHIITIIIL